MRMRRSSEEKHEDLGISDFFALASLRDITILYDSGFI